MKCNFSSVCFVCLVDMILLRNLCQILFVWIWLSNPLNFSNYPTVMVVVIIVGLSHFIWCVLFLLMGFLGMVGHGWLEQNLDLDLRAMNPRM